MATGQDSPPKRLTRAQQAAARREQLLAVAVNHFALKGYEGTSLEDVASEAGVTKGLLYHYFGSKEELFLEGIASFDFETAIDAIPAITAGTPVEDILRVVLTESTKVLDAHRRDISVLIVSMNTGNKAARDRLLTLVRSFEARLSEALQHAPDLDPEANCPLVAENLVSALVFGQIWRTVDRDTPPMDEFVASLLRTARHGLVARTS